MPRRWLLTCLVATVLVTTPMPHRVEAAGRCGDRAWCDTDLSPDRRAGLLLRAMTLGERLRLLAGTQTDDFNARMAGVPRLGFPGFLIADGPAGVSRPDDGGGVAQPAKGEALALPAGIALAASFDPATARRYGETAGAEARDRGVDVLLGPALDLVRTPYAGRGFETLSGEDPLLGARLGAAWIRGAQSRGPIATAKHYVAYNQEADRFGPAAVNAVVDERTLRELYLPPFEAAVDAGVGTVMSSYNRINGAYADENRPLLRGILKNEWRFRGAVISDFTLGTHGTASSLRAGLDVELPGAVEFAPARVRAAIAAGRLRRADVNRAVQRVLRTLFSFGVPDRAAFPNRGPGVTPPSRRRAARELAERGIVLLRNRGRALPLDGRRLRSLAVVGDAARAYEAGGGPVLLPWTREVAAIVQAWYPGQQGGDAIARVLFGDVDATGRLPQTFPRRLEDLAVRTPRQYPGVRAPGAGFPEARYTERLRVGYRHADTRGLDPAFAFGHGLSYTTFTFRDLRVARKGGGGLRASVLVRNTGDRAGDAAPRLYLGVPDRPGLAQPPWRLAGFARVALASGAARRVAFPLDRRALSSWDPRRNRWTVVRGCHRVAVGASSRDFRTTRRVAVGGGRCR